MVNGLLMNNGKEMVRCNCAIGCTYGAIGKIIMYIMVCMFHNNN